jgi:hypothetical protein
MSEAKVHVSMELHFQEQQMHDGDELAGDIRLEEQLSKNTAQYNRLLSEQPSNVELWVKYVQFQVQSSFICFISVLSSGEASPLFTYKIM